MFIHCIWEFDKIRKFWREMMDTIMTILSVTFPFNPLFHIYARDLNLRAREYTFVKFAILEAK